MTQVSKQDQNLMISKEDYSNQVMIARQYPRDVKKAIDKIIMYATVSPKVAESCFYSIKRTDREGKTVFITGESIRFAEIVAHSWGNIRAGSKIVGEDDKSIKAVGFVEDLENNIQIVVEAHKKITNRFGQLLPEHLILQLGMAASSIAFRNAIFKAVPLVMLAEAKEKIKSAVLGNVAKDFATIKKQAIEYFTSKGVTEKQILTAVGKSKISEINQEDVLVLRGIATGVEDKEYTIEEAFTAVAPKEKAPSKMSRASNALGQDDDETEEKKS